MGVHEESATRQLKGQLTDLNLRNLTTRDRPYKVADGNGLFVLVSPTGPWESTPGTPKT
jgi:hypothetical protein